jgi:hypothetical protein
VSLFEFACINAILFLRVKPNKDDKDLARHFSKKLNGGIKKSESKPRFSDKEVLRGLEIFQENQAFLDSQSGGSMTAIKKKKILNEIAIEMTALSGVPRTGTEALRKINQVRSAVKGKGINGMQ